MARRVRLGVSSNLRQHSNGHGSEPHNHQPVLLPQRKMPQPDIGADDFRRYVQKHHRHVRDKQAADASRVQQLNAMPKHHALGSEVGSFQ